jgi:TPR repeat protein
VPDVIPVEKNEQEALKYHTIAARLGSAEACYFLMSSNIHGSNGSNKSYLDAVEWGNLGLAQPLLQDEQTDIYIQLNWELGLLYSKFIEFKIKWKAVMV